MTGEQEPTPFRDRPITEIADRLQNVLGQEMVAYAIHEGDPRRIGAFARGEASPEPEEEETLRDLGQLTEELLDNQGRPIDIIQGVMIGVSSKLENEAPIQLIREGQAERVLRVAPFLFKA